MSTNVVKNYYLPAGCIMSYAGSTAPSDWLLCDGSAISRIDYKELFEVIGTTYGIGDGSTTFNLPNLKGRTIVGVGESSATGHTNHTLGQSSGEETHTLVTSEMPKHSHSTGIWTCYYSDGGNYVRGSAGSTGVNLTYTSDIKGGDGAHNNMQPYLVTNYIIYTGK